MLLGTIVSYAISKYSSLRFLERKDNDLFLLKQIIVEENGMLTENELFIKKTGVSRVWGVEKSVTPMRE